MRWRKLGQVFKLAEHQLPSGCVGFAQSPQPVVFDGFVRVFFSTRTVDPTNGKFFSEVAFADFAPDFSEVLRVAGRPVIQRGELGCFDEHGIFPMNVVKRGSELWGYTSGWSRRVSVSVETGIGLAISRDDGETFERVGNGPVLSASAREPFLVGDGFFLDHKCTFHMWYIFGTSWTTFDGCDVRERTYKIGHAVSCDGITWAKPSEGQAIVPNRLGGFESQALPCVIPIGGAFHMFFCYRQSSDFRTNPSRGYRIGHAVSSDLTTWLRDDDAIPLGTEPNAWDSGMMCYPGVCESAGRTYLLYNGNEFGRHGFGAAVLEG